MIKISGFSANKIILLFFFPFNLIIAQTDSSWQQISNQERSANAFPIIMYDSDIGFGFGGKAVLKNRYQKQETIDVTIFASTKGEQWYAFQFSAPDFEYRQGKQYALSLDARIEWDKMLKTNYFGIGNSTRDNNFQFPSEFFRFATIVGHAFSSHWIIELGYQFSHYSVYGFDPTWGTITDETPGAGQSNVSGFSSGIRFDSRDSHINPTGGVRIYLKTGLSDKKFGSDWNFASYRLESNFYVNLYRRKHSIAARFWSQQIDGLAPVQELSMIGDGWTARGYKAGRFLDKAMMLTSLEYRFPLFKKLGGVLFADAGRVSPELKLMNLNDWHSDWGWGLRYFLQTFIVRFDMGSSKEGTRIFFNFGHVF